MSQLTTKVVQFVVLSVFALTARASTAVPSLCKDNEEVFFSCMVRSKIISLCASADASETAGSLTYRFGKKGGLVEIEYPSTPTAPGNAFVFSREIGAKGGSEQLAFAIGKFSYTLYSYHWAGADPQRISGVFVENDGKRVANVQCTNPDSQLGMHYLGEDIYHFNQKLGKHFIGLPSGKFRVDLP